MDGKLGKVNSHEPEVPLNSIDVNMIKKETASSLIHECKACKMVYSSYSNLERHVKHAHTSKIKCSVCNLEVLKKYYRHHLKKVHGLLQPKPERNDENENRDHGGGSMGEKPDEADAISKDEQPNDDDKNMMMYYNGIACQICNQVYSNKVNLKKHVYNVHRMVRVKCNVCDKEVNKKSLNRHMRNIHRTKTSMRKEKKSVQNEEKVSCTICEKECSNSASLNQHVRSVHKEEQYKCNQCDFQGIRKHLDRHIKKEHNEEVYQCGRCQKILKSKSTLKEHMWIHTDHRRFICDVCGMRFKRTSNYYGHMKSHQEKKFQCRICGNFFLRKRYLAMHEQTIHNYYGEGVPPQEKGYQCEICGVKLKWKNNLLAHMRIHTGEKPYKCKICGEDFTCHGSLRTHMAKHCFILRIDSSDIELLGSGLAKIKKDDIIIRFFVTLKNHGKKTRSVFGEMIECCEDLSKDDFDCESFQLQDDYTKIMPGKSQNLTLIYPNIYVYDRKGFCVVSVWHKITKSDEKEDDDKPVRMRLRIAFDTIIRQAPHEIPRVIEGFYNPKLISKCDTTDLDPFDECRPVNCHIKYSGFRNYYNARIRRCEKVPICNGDPSKELADVVYIPDSNKCRDLENFITEDDIEGLLDQVMKEPEGNIDLGSVFIKCQHGEINKKTGLCVCDYGWKSEKFDPNGGSLVYIMCNVECHQSSVKYLLLPLVIGTSMAFFLVLWICFCEKYQVACTFMKKVPHASDEDCSCLPKSVS